MAADGARRKTSPALLSGASLFEFVMRSLFVPLLAPIHLSVNVNGVTLHPHSRNLDDVRKYCVTRTSWSSA
jgi:hypothetical protein